MEHTTKIIALEVLGLVVFALLIAFQSFHQGSFNFVSGSATTDAPSKEQILAVLEQKVPTLGFVKDSGDFSACIMVDIDSATRYSFEVVKVSTAVAVTDSEGQCKGADKEDFVLYYPTYAALKQNLDSGSFDVFKKGADGSSFWVYPSKQILSGMKLSDPVAFKQQFGKVMDTYFTSEEADQILSSQLPVSQQPASFISYMFYVFVGLFAVILIITFVVFRYSAKPQIKENLEMVAFIKSSLAQGYDEAQLRQSLAQSGWGDDEINEAFKTVNMPLPEAAVAQQ